jgi:hypothetical protein
MAFFLTGFQAPAGFRLVAAAPPEPLTEHPAFTGISVFDLQVDGNGTVTDIKLIRGQPPFVEHSREAMSEWEFTATRLSTPLHVSVTFVYKAKTDLPDRPIALSVPAPAEPHAVAVPVHVIVPGYPISGRGEGSVVLQADIAASGRVQRLDAIHAIPSLTESAMSAVREWTFSTEHMESAQLPHVAIVVISFQVPEYGVVSSRR